MDLHQCKLVNEPPPVTPLFHSVAFKFARTMEETELAVASPDRSLTPMLVSLWDRFKSAGTEWINNDQSYFEISVPELPQLPARLHICVPVVTYDDIERGRGARSIRDFDRTMDIAAEVIREMVEAQILSVGKQSIDIVAEPLNFRGTLYEKEVCRVASDIGCSWLTLPKAEGSARMQIFRTYRIWDPRAADWIRS